MSFRHDPFFKALFDVPLPRIILKGDAPHFTVMAINTAFQAAFTQNREAIDLSFWNTFDPDQIVSEDGRTLQGAFAQALKSNQPLPPFPCYSLTRGGNGTTDWWQLEIVPVIHTDGCTYLLTTIHNLTHQVINKQALKDGTFREQELSEELAATNEELAASNEELSATIEELHLSQAALQETNEQLENRVLERTKALAESEADAQALNEELSAINEEMTAVNEELVATNEELAQSQAELQELVTELTLAKEAVERSARLFRTIALNIPGSLIMVIGQDRRYLLVEGDLKNMVGLNADKDYTGMHPAEAFTPERYEQTSDLYDRMLSGEQFSMERTGQHGGIFTVHFVPLHNQQDEVYAGLIIALDITEIREAEERSAKLAAIVETSHDAIISKSLDGIITSWNQAAERIFGYTPEEIIGQPVLQLIPQELHHEESVILAKVRSGELVEHFETRRITKDGRLIDLSLTVSPVKDKRGKIIGLSKIARDISEKKRDELRKNDFIGMVSHELKTPLTSLSAIIQVTNAKLKNSPDTFLAGAMQKAGIQVTKMTKMINGFLNISRLESGKIQIDKQTFNLEDLIDETIKETEVTAGGQPIILHPCKPVTIEADYDKIGSVISNLISNALKYSGRDRPVTINCTISGNMAVVSIKDEGMGIHPKDLERLFDRYYRVDDPNTKHISGFGIGLYLSAEIIRRHYGDIWVESQIGKGSTFYFSLPLKNA